MSLAYSDIDINLIVERRPDQICITNSWEYGIGGFSIKIGKVFWYEIPSRLRLKVSNNVLEYLAEIVAIWKGVLDREISSGSCIFSSMDNTSVVRWTRKLSFMDTSQERNIIISRFLAKLIMNHRFCLYTQYFVGFLNVVADALSRDFYLSDSFLTNPLFYFYPN